MFDLFADNGLRSPGRYSLDSTESIALLNEELHTSTIDHSTGTSGTSIDTNEDTPVSNNVYKLLRVWTWIDRCEARGYKLNHGLLHTFITTGDIQPLSTKPTPLLTLLCPNSYMLHSPLREHIRMVCGWTSNSLMESALPSNGGGVDLLLEEIVEDMEGSGEFDRAAAIALWHGNVCNKIIIL